MAAQHDGERHDGRDALDLVAVRRVDAEVDHGAHHGDGEGVHPLEALGDLGHLLEEVGGLGFLGRRAPLHVDAEHVRAQCEEEVEADPAEEDREHRHPLEVLEERADERFLAQAVTEDGEADVAEAGEDDEEGDEDAPRLDVEGVDVAIVPADEEVVQDGERETEGEGVVGRDVGEDGDFGGHLHVGEEEAAEEGREWGFPEPGVHRVEDELVTAVGVLLPTGQLVVDGQGHTLFEFIAVVCRKADDASSHLHTQRDIEILRHVAF